MIHKSTSMKPGLNTGPYLTYVRWLGEEYQSEDL